jgi:hypothetical protein
MTDLGQRDDRALMKLEDSAKRVSMGDLPPNQFLDPAALYVARAPVPSRLTVLKSLGRASYGRKNAHKPGISLFVPENSIDNFEELKKENRAVAAKPTGYELDYRPIPSGEWSNLEPILDHLLEHIGKESKIAQETEDIDGKLSNFLLPAIICVFEIIDETCVRWRGPGSEGRVQFDESLEETRGLSAWVPPSCLHSGAQPTEVARLCDADERGQSHTIGEIDL